MKLSTMRHIDYWVGVPVCYLLSLWIKLRDAVVPRERDRKGRILFIELSEMGSTILAAPAIQRAIQRSVELSGKQPCFVINGRLLVGERPIEKFRTLIEQALAEQAKEGK